MVKHRLTKKTKDHDQELHIIKEVRVKRSQLRATQYKLNVGVFKRMLLLGLPPAMFNTIYWLAQNTQARDHPDVDYVEWYSGVANVKNACEEIGWNAFGFDIVNHGVFQNALTKEGWLTTVQYLRRQRPGAGNHWATVCSTWVWMARASCFRHPDQPLGLPDRRSDVVLAANHMVTLMAMCILFIMASKGSWILEQPASSIMVCHPRMKQVREALGKKWVEVSTCMDKFGAETPKTNNIVFRQWLCQAACSNDET